MKRHIIWLLVILLIAFIFRSAFLGSKSVWLDEAFSVWMAERPVDKIWTVTADHHPPLYYLLLKTWMILGKSEAIIRLPSVLVSMVGLALLYLLARRLFNEKVALFSTILLALSPLDIWYAQEARMNIFVASAGLLIALGLSMMGLKGFILITVGLAFGLYVDYPIIPVWIILSGIWFAYWWKEGRSIQQLLTWLAASAAAWLLFMPLWPRFLAVINRMSTIFVFANLREAAALPDFGVLPQVAALILLGIGAAIAARWAPDILAHPVWGKRVAAALVLAFILITLLVPIPRLYSLKRLAVTGWPFVVLAVTWLAVVKLGSSKSYLIGLFAASFIATLVALLAVPKDDWRSATAHINQNAAQDDIVWLEPSFGKMPYGYYEPVIEPSISLEALEEQPGATVWHIAERQPNRPIPGSNAEIWLDENRRLLEVIPFYRLELRHYSSAE